MTRGDQVLTLADAATTHAEGAASAAQTVRRALSPLSRGSTPAQVREASRTALAGLLMSLQESITAAHRLGQLESAGEMTDG